MTIKFKVANQILERLDREIVVADSKNYLYAAFEFSTDWDGLNKTAQFTRDGVTYDKDVTNGSCLVPWEVLVGAGVFYVNVFGGDLITVNECAVRVGESGMREGQLPEEPTPGYFDSAVTTVKGYRDEAEGFADETKADRQAVEDTKITVDGMHENVARWAGAVAGSVVNVENKAGEVDAQAAAVESALQEIESNRAEVAQNTQLVAGNTEIVVQKAAAVDEDATQVSSDKSQVSSDKGVVLEKANTVSLDKEIVAADKATVAQYKDAAQQGAGTATEQALLSEYYANMAASIVSSMPMRYYRISEEGMESITNPVQGDLCYVTNFSDGISKLYVYDTVDMDADNNNPEWVFIGNLEFASLDRATLLGILQLGAAALSNDYNDLDNKPNRYENRIVLDSATWDYSLGYWAVLTLTADSTLSITNLYNGAYGIIDVYGGFALTLPANSYQTPPDWDYLVPTVGQHYVYSFRYDGSKFSWHRSVEYDT